VAPRWVLIDNVRCFTVERNQFGIALVLFVSRRRDRIDARRIYHVAPFYLFPPNSVFQSLIYSLVPIRLPLRTPILTLSINTSIAWRRAYIPRQTGRKIIPARKNRIDRHTKLDRNQSSTVKVGIRCVVCDFTWRNPECAS
jgi:hypothetical protein